MGNCFGDDDEAEFKIPIANAPDPSPPAPRQNQEYDSLFKVLLIGDSSVGKTSICTRFTDNTFTDNFIATLGVDFKIRTLTIDGFRVRLQVWDTAGQERFRTITQAFYRGTHGVIVVYDISDRETYDSVARWLDDTQKYAPDSAIKMLVGNKSDLTTERQVSEKEGQDFAKQHNMLFMEASAKDSVNIEEMFYKIAGVFVKTA